MAAVFWLTAGAVDLSSGQIPNTLRHSLFAPDTDPQAAGKQGASLALDGPRVVIGAPHEDGPGEGATDCGVVRIHELASSDLLHELASPDGEPFGHFGQAVAISGDIVVVGSGLAAGEQPYAGKVHVFDLSSPTPREPVLVLADPDPDPYDQFGQSLAIDGDRIVVGAWLDDEGDTDTGAAYVYDLGSPTPAVPVLVLPNPDPAAGDCFGVAVGISGSRVVVGSYGDDAAAPDAGAAYVFDLDAPAPTEAVAVLALPAAAERDGFGQAVAISGGLVAVAAEAADDGLANAGKVAVFDLDGATPEEPLALLASPAAEENGYFGSSLALQGERLIVGEYRKSTSAGQAGVCHVFDLGGGTPETPVLLLTKASPVEGDFLGGAVALSGDIVLAGAAYDDDGELDAGMVWKFDLAAPLPGLPVGSLGSPVPDSADHFGAAVAIAGDWVAVGAPESESGATGAGRATLFDLASSNPKVPYLVFENPVPVAADGFGGAVAVGGARMIVGAAGVDAGAADAGAVYVYDLTSATPTVPALELLNPDPGAGDGFGACLALAGDLLLVGAAGDDTLAADAGRAYLFDLGGPQPGTPVAVLDNPRAAAGDRFGAAVALSATFAAVGVAGDDTTGAESGCVQVFSATGSWLLTVENPTPLAGDGFGTAVALADNLLAAAAPDDDAGATDAGVVHVFDLASPLPGLPQITLGPPVPAAGDRFGSAVAMSGLRVVAGAPLTDSPTDSGRVYSYHLASPTPGVPSAVNSKSTRTSGDLFGAAVAVDGAIIVIGTPSDNRTAADKGAAYVFGPDAPEIAVAGPHGGNLLHASTVDLGAVAMGPAGSTVSFTILNTGITSLAVSGVTAEGGNAGDFTIDTAAMATTVAAGDDTQFSVTFSPTAAGVRTTTLRIANSDSNENPFDLELTGRGLSPGDDSDGDGLNDVAELQMAGLGFRWDEPDPERVATFLTHIGTAGYYAPPGGPLGVLQVNRPGLTREPGTGRLKLSLALEKGPPSSSLQPLPMTPGDVRVNEAGEVEFKFTDPGGADFIQLETE
jgi:hypothetical protein